MDMKNYNYRLNKLTYCLLFITVASTITACNSGSGTQQINTPPHVTDNSVLTDQTCAKYDAGYASAKFNVLGVLDKRKYSKIETCSKWYSLAPLTNSLNQSKLQNLNSYSPYDFSNNTVINWGQAGANSILFINDSSYYPGTNIPDIQYPLESYIQVQNSGTYGSPQIINTSYNSNLPQGNQPQSWGNYYGFYPFFPDSKFPTNATNVVNVTAYNGVMFPRVCNDDTRDNFSADVMLIMPSTTDLEASNVVYYNYPVSFLNYCSWQGTTEGNYDQYSSVVQMYGGITADQVLSQPMSSDCTYSTTNPNTGSSKSSLTCNVNNYNFTISLQEFFSNLSQYPSSNINPEIEGSKCYLSGNNRLNGYTNYCTQNGWALNVTQNN